MSTPNLPHTLKRRGKVQNLSSISILCPKPGVNQISVSGGGLGVGDNMRLGDNISLIPVDPHGITGDRKNIAVRALCFTMEVFCFTADDDTSPSSDCIDNNIMLWNNALKKQLDMKTAQCSLTVL